MTRRRKVLFTLGVFFVGVMLFRLLVLPDLLTRQMAVTSDGDQRTPAALGLSYQDASFEVGGDRLVAWFVRPPDPKPVAFLLLHGDGESVSDWIPVQKLLHDHGYASLVYDFAGYGNSGGQPSTRMFDAEPRQALRALLDRVGPATRVSVLGHSFGAAIAVEAFHVYDDPRIHSLIFNSGPPALHDILREVVGVPAPLVMLLPNLVNAKHNIRDFDVPVLVIGSEADELFSPNMTRRVYDGAKEPKQLLIHQESGHNELTRADPDWWLPILEWVGTL